MKFSCKKSVSYIVSFFIIFSFQITHAEESNKSDTTIFKDTGLLTNVSPITDSTNFEKQLSQNPTTGLFKSMFVPGWGQFGNKRKIKALLFLSFDIWMISKALDHRKKSRDLWDTFNSFEDLNSRNIYHNLYTQERNRRNKYTWYAVITSFFAMFDAYIDAHLSGFPKGKENKFSIDIKPTASSGNIVSLSINF